MSIHQQIAEAQKQLRAYWKVTALRENMFPEWWSLKLEEAALVARLKTVRAEKRAIERRYSTQHTTKNVD